MARSPLERVLSLPEIWIIVFECFDDEDDTDHASLANCSRVSHSWHKLAERPLWRNLPSVIPLFQLLGPMTTDPQVPDEDSDGEDYTEYPLAEYGPWVSGLVHI